MPLPHPILKLSPCCMDQSLQRHAVLPGGFDNRPQHARQHVGMDRVVILAIDERHDGFVDHAGFVHGSTVAQAGML